MTISQLAHIPTPPLMREGNCTAPQSQKIPADRPAVLRAMN
jgi:hypothetical protein